MIVRYLLAALCAGLLAGLLITPLQYARVVPLILQAEAFEAGGGARAPHDHLALFVTPARADTPAEVASSSSGAAFILAHDSAAQSHGEQGSHGAAPLARLAGTLLANLVTGAGFALILSAASLILGVPVTAANGLSWGLAGFAVMSLAPALGLAPELPAMPAGDLPARQAWWLATVALTAAGAYALLLRREPLAKAAGAVAFALPHLYGAPQPADLASPVPPTLAAEFAVASLVTALGFWLILGRIAGHAFDRARGRSVLTRRAA